MFRAGGGCDSPSTTRANVDGKCVEDNLVSIASSCHFHCNLCSRVIRHDLYTHRNIPPSKVPQNIQEPVYDESVV